jgi:hypothetical protein
MPKFVVKVQPSGLINGQAWPEVGEPIELSEEAAAGMVDSGVLEKPAAKKSAAKVEKRPASKANVETRKS